MNPEIYAKHTQFYSEDVPPLLLNLLGGTEWNSYADLGCGDGALLKALNETGCFDGKSVFAVDLSETRLGLVKQINEQFDCQVGDVCSTRLENGSIDFLTSTQVIEHVDSDGDMVREILRILAPTGTVYLSTVFKKWYGWYFYRCNGKWTLDPTHLREYTRDCQLLDLFDQYGFEILENKKTLDGRPILDSILRRIGAGRNAYNNRFLRLLRRFSVPIPGYYIWEIVCAKK